MKFETRLKLENFQAVESIISSFEDTKIAEMKQRKTENTDDIDGNVINHAELLDTEVRNLRAKMMNQSSNIQLIRDKPVIFHTSKEGYIELLIDENDADSSTTILDNYVVRDIFMRYLRCLELIATETIIDTSSVKCYFLLQAINNIDPNKSNNFLVAYNNLNPEVATSSTSGSLPGYYGDSTSKIDKTPPQHQNRHELFVKFFFFLLIGLIVCTPCPLLYLIVIPFLIYWIVKQCCCKHSCE